MIRAALAGILLWLILGSPAADAAVRAFLDRDSITLGETVTLNIEIDGMSAVQPDLAPLQTSFRLLGTSNSTQLQLVNGQQTARRLWAVALEPLAAGVVGIPALQVGSEKTAPLSLTVLPAPQGASNHAGDDVFLEVDASPVDPYVQQQVSYVLRLYHAVNLAEGQLEEPQVDGARLLRLGGDTRYEKRLADRRYAVVERRYALIPERSGTLEVSAPRFRGSANDGSLGSFFNSGRRLQATGDAVTLEVRPQPPGSATPWLPAIELSLSDESEPAATELRAGEPITLSLRLAARGLGADQLPELQLPPIAGAQVYPDLESSQTGDSGEWLAGERIRRFAVVPSAAGELTIPAIRIPWWNTQTDSREIAEIPSRRLTILAGTMAATAGSAPVPASAAGESVTDVDARSDPLRGNPWPWISLLFATLWIATLVGLLRRRGAAAEPAAHARPPNDPTLSQRALQRALEVGDLAEIARRLRELAPPGSGIGLDRLVQRLDDPQQAAAAAALDRALYAAVAPMQRDDLLRQLRAAFRAPPRWRPEAASARAAASDSLPPLYGRPG